jgi:5-methylcytosine-specific restriction endonuclease McrA
MPNWIGSNRRTLLPADWPTIVKRILIRDHHRCQHVREDTQRKCGRRATDVDHITRPADGGTDDDSNLQALCSYHHGQKTGREGGIASGRSRQAARDAAKPLHPGLLQEAPKPETPAPF